MDGEDAQERVVYERTIIGTLFVGPRGHTHFLDETGPRFFPSAQAVNRAGD